MRGIFSPLVNDFFATKKLRVIGATRVCYFYNITLCQDKSNVLTSENLSRAVRFLSRVHVALFGNIYENSHAV